MAWLARLINVFRAGKISDDIDRELEFHLAERVDDLTAAGVPQEAARREARRRLGSYTIQREDTRERDLLVWLESLFADVRHGLRALFRQPVFAATTILTLAIGIGANTTVFTLLHGLLLRSLPVAAPERLVRVGLVFESGPGGMGLVDFGMLKRIDELDRTLDGLSAWRTHHVAVEDADGTLRFQDVAFVTGNAFDQIGMHARLGRLLTPRDDVAGGPPDAWPVVLGDRYWRERFAAGAILGAAGLFFAVRLIDGMLYGVTSFDWRTLTGVAVTLTVVVLLASFWPARRAASVDPLVAIRTD